MEKLLAEFSTGLFVWQTVLFVILLVVLRKVAWPKIMSSIEEREESISKALESAEEAKKEMAALQASNEQLLQEAREERDRMLREARDTKDQIISEAKSKAEDEANKMIASAKATIDGEKKRALAEIKTTSAELALAVAEKVLRTELSSDEKQKELANKYVEEISLN
jgi:F-type H+-transporting ATPase subunit b